MPGYVSDGEVIRKCSYQDPLQPWGGFVGAFRQDHFQQLVICL